MAHEPESHPRTDPWARLRAEHERLLRRVQRLEGRVAITAAGRLPAAGLRSLRAFAAHLAGAFAAHMAVEETDLHATLGARFPELHEPLSRLHADHAAMREMTRDLLELLDAPGDARRDERLFVLTWDLAELLRLHFRAEERLAFEWRTRLASAPVRLAQIAAPQQTAEHDAHHAPPIPEHRCSACPKSCRELKRRP